jgi:hypothetical protein
MSDKWRVQCHYTPYGVSDDVFTDKKRLIAFVTERLDKMGDSLSRMQIDKQRTGKTK